MFDDVLLDGQLLRTVGAAPYGGADIGECLAAARRVAAPVGVATSGLAPCSCMGRGTPGSPSFKSGTSAHRFYEGLGLTASHEGMAPAV